MSKFDDFVAQFNGTSVEVVDASNKYQCFDLAVAWVQWLGLQNSFQHLYAYSIYSSPTELTKQNFELIENTPLAVPQEGDIVVWSKKYNGTAGHVAIATGKGDINQFFAFSQNDPIGAVSQIKKYKYDNVLGWLRPRIYIAYNWQVEENARKGTAFDRYLTFLYSRGLTPDSDSRKYDELIFIEVFNKLFTDNELHRSGYLEFQEKYKDAEKEIKGLKNEAVITQKEIEVLKNEVKQVKDTADIDLQKALADQKDKLLIEWGVDKEAWNKSKLELEKTIKEKCVEIEKLVETPLSERFAGSSMSFRIKAILEIIGAPKKKI